MAPHAEAPGLAAFSNTFGLKVIDAKTSNKDDIVTDDVVEATNGGLIDIEDRAQANTDVKETSSTLINGKTIETAKGEDAETKPVAIKESEIGATSSSTSIYRSSPNDHGEDTWTKEYPKDVPEAAENDETAKFAIVVRKKPSSDSRKKLEVDSIVVQSPWLRKVLREVLEDYPGVSCDIKRLMFEAPFKPFVHRWASFLKALRRTDLDEQTAQHLKLLHSILVEEIGTLIKEYEDYVLNGIITFETLWMIYQPGSVVTAELKGPLSGFEVDDSEYIKNNCGEFLNIHADSVDWNGQIFGRCRENILVPKFKGTKKITSLNAVPLALRSDREKLRLKLIERGKRFEALGGYCYKAYNGTAITWDQQLNEQSIYVTGRIIVDVDSFTRYTNYPYRFIEPFNERDAAMLTQYNEELNNGSTDMDSDAEDTLATPGKKTWNLKLPSYLLLLCRSRTRGYSLKLKKWLDFFVPIIADVEWNSNAFDNLVLPEDQKELILSFTESQTMNREAFDDIIAGKGRGIIMLLAGSPGVGKTLTAEAVAEHMRRPLHSITSGDLGSHPREVEFGLSRTLDLVSRWNAILLIDECDVFLEARSTQDLERNKIVSIFLRTLEYYEGIMFMTTNRSDNIDNAFQSRIHVSMEYPDLTVDARKQIWQNFVQNLSQPSELTDMDFSELAEVSLNGRQIKNVLKTSQLLALRKKVGLNRQMIETVLAVGKRNVL